MAGTGTKKKKGKKPTKKEKRKRLNRAIIIIAAAAALGFSVTAVLWSRRENTVPVIHIYPDIENSDDSADLETEYREIAEGAEEGVPDTVYVDPGPESEEILTQPEFTAGKNIMIIIDDVGYNLQELHPFLEIDGPLVFAILPEVPFSGEAADLILQAGYQYIIHQPMEAMSAQNLGSNPITSDMDDNAIIKTMERSFRDLPDAMGMNNHMGSKITSNAEQMDVILRTLSMHNMIFIDSLTISDSGVKKAAEKLQLPYFRREIFLDNTQTEEYYTEAFYAGLKKGEKLDLVIMIGHVWADGLAETLTKLYEEAAVQGYTFITVGDLPKGDLRYAGAGN